MNGRGLFLALASFFVATPTLAQTAPEGAEMGAGGQTPPSAWPVYPRERHVWVRAEYATGVRLRDPFGQGRLAPHSLLVQGSFGFVHLGQWILGPSLGVQVGIASPFTQIGIQPGVTIHRRLSHRLALTGRVDLPLFITKGGAEIAGLLPVPSGRPNEIGMGSPGFINNVPYPTGGYNPALAPGIEVAAGVAVYLRAGLAVTAEAIVNTYFGDSQFVYPIVGGGVGLLFDYEMLP